jgi:hypothetical protein
MRRLLSKISNLLERAQTQRLMFEVMFWVLHFSLADLDRLRPCLQIFDSSFEGPYGAPSSLRLSFKTRQGQN